MIGKFIVFEGLDGAGTTTQLRLLEENLSKAGVNVFATAEPTDSPVGRLIRSALRKEFAIEPKTLAMLYATDRYEHIYGKNGIREHLDAGEIVICDRYLYSSIAYQSVTCGMEYIRALNDRFLEPDLLFYVDTPVDECMKRISTRNQTAELFEKFEYLTAVKKNYDYIMTAKECNSYLDGNPIVVRLDGMQAKDTIAEEVFEKVKRILK